MGQSDSKAQSVIPQPSRIDILKQILSQNFRGGFSLPSEVQRCKWTIGLDMIWADGRLRIG